MEVQASISRRREKKNLKMFSVGCVKWGAQLLSRGQPVRRHCVTANDQKFSTRASMNADNMSRKSGFSNAFPRECPRVDR
jgi:hypothetical protein